MWLQLRVEVVLLVQGIPWKSGTIKSVNSSSMLAESEHKGDSFILLLYEIRHVNRQPTV